MDQRPRRLSRLDGLIERARPPDRFRIGPFKADAFRSRLHSERVASVLGVALGVAFGLCFVTGLVSHAIQHPPAWFTWPSRPAGLYRVTQGLHVAAGIASIPLLLAKLWSVYPKLWRWPLVTSVAHVIERFSLVPLVAGSLFLLFTGTVNTFGWYPWGFFFPAGHYWAAWITIGALIIHVGAKLTQVRVELLRPRATVEPDPDRRRFLWTAFGGSAALTLLTVGQTVRPLRAVSLLAPRDPAAGPQGFPVNRSARSAGVTEAARDDGWRLIVEGNVERPLVLALGDLQRMPQRTATIPIACVEGWSVSLTWTGVPVRDLLEAAGARPGAEVRVESLQPRGLYRTSLLNPVHARDPDTLLALQVHGQTLHIEHGFPCRLIGPNRPGVMQTKWVRKLVVT